MPRVAEFMEEVAQVVERIPSASNAGPFLRHRGHQAFRDSPASGRNGFEVKLDSYETAAGFGIAEQKQTEIFLIVTLGHAAIAPDDERLRHLSEDLERVVDVLEAKRDWRAGSGGSVDLVQCDTRGRPDYTNPSWWVTPLTFRALVWGPTWRE